MINVEEIQQLGKQQFDNAVASAATLQQGVQAIAGVVEDFTKKSFDDGNAYVGKLATVNSMESAISVQSEFAKASYDTFVAESQKIGALYADLARQSFKPFEGLFAHLTPTR